MRCSVTYWHWIRNDFKPGDCVQSCPFDRVGRAAGVSSNLARTRIVEHDPEAIWESQLAVARLALERATLDAEQIAAIGITNQRETTVLWDRSSGRPVAPAVVWQSRVSAPICERLKSEGHEAVFRRKTGLLLDPYFSGTKIKHLLDQDTELRQRARAWRCALRHRRFFLDLASDRRSFPCDRRFQCEPDVADEPGDPGLGRRVAWHFGSPTRDAPQGL